MPDADSDTSEASSTPKASHISSRTKKIKDKVGKVDLDAPPPDDHTIVTLGNNTMTQVQRHQAAPMVWDVRGRMRADFHYLLDRNESEGFWSQEKVRVMTNGMSSVVYEQLNLTSDIFYEGKLFYGRETSESIIGEHEQRVEARKSSSVYSRPTASPTTSSDSELERVGDQI
ncbi:MAG: hypothetical protein L6R36_003756 [Xanthoria steineri]|nr:MAG: hypothetical protein L6R36_003756 [Xanthoria steineri]